MKATYTIVLASLAYVGAAAATEPPRRAAVASSPITVQAGDRSIASWSSDVSKSLTNAMIYPSALHVSDIEEGAVRVRFHCDAQGRPDGLVLAQSSHHATIDRAAMAAVSHIGTLYPLPAGITADRPMEAWLVFAADQDNSDRMMHQLQKQHQAELARASGTGADALLAASMAPVVFAAH